MAVVHPVGAAGPDEPETWLVLEGTLKEADLPSLLDTVAASNANIVTLDLCDLGALTAGGCWTIRQLADDLWLRGCQLSIVVPIDGPIVELLRSTGTFESRRIRYQVSAT